MKLRAKQLRAVSWYRPLPPQPRLPMVAPGWSRSAAALFALTEGTFDPRRCAVKGPRQRAEGAEARPLVSVVAPTSWVRRGFHPLLYECFCKQEIGLGRWGQRNRMKQHETAI